MANKRCDLFAKQSSYLGLIIDNDRLHACKSKVKAIVEAPNSQNITQVIAFASLVQYYSKVVPNLSGILSPFYNL